MKLHTFNAPNPFRVHVFLVEKEIDLPTEKVDLMQGAHREPAFLAKNSLGEVPVLELDDGTILTESIAICRHLENLNPAQPLMGATPADIARIEMWNRRMELRVFETIGNVARHSFEFFAPFVDQIPAFAESQKGAMTERWRWLDAELADGRTYIVEDAFSVADITGMAVLMVCDFAEIALPGGLKHVARWEAAVRGRPSWARARELV